MNPDTFILGGLCLGSSLNKSDSLIFLDKAYKLGIRNIDTGSLYGNGQSEEIISCFNRSSNKKFKIHTKIGLIKKIRSDNSFGVDLASLTPEYIEKAIKKSLHKCKVDNLEKVSLHAFCNEIPIEDQIGKLSEMINKGYINSYGICNFEKEELSKWLSICFENNLKYPDSLDLHLNLLEQKAVKEIFPYLEGTTVKAIPHRILCRGILAGRYKDPNQIPINSRGAISSRVKRYITKENIEIVKNIEKLAHKKNMNLLDLVLNWTLSFDVVDQLCIGTASINQLEKLANSLKKECNYSEEINQEIYNLLDKQLIYELPTSFFEK